MVASAADPFAVVFLLVGAGLVVGGLSRSAWRGSDHERSRGVQLGVAAVGVVIVLLGVLDLAGKVDLAR